MNMSRGLRTACRHHRSFASLRILQADKLVTTTKPKEDPFGIAAVQDVLLEDLTSLQRDELHEHRQLRDYYRKIIYELPQLEAFQKPAPTRAAEQLLQFRETTYFGESHPAMHKVTLQVKLRHLAEVEKLTGQQLETLVKIAGPRVDHDTYLLRMSSEQFASAAENKRHLSALLDKLLQACRTGDTFEDVPLDRRHMKKTKRPGFPKHWRITTPAS